MTSSLGHAASASLAVPHTQNTAPVIEYRCLFTPDLRRKQKRWQDGKLKFHTHNKRVMVYDERANFVGDTHWRKDHALAEGEEFELERGILIEVAECLGKTDQDLTELVDKRRKEKEDRAAVIAGRTPVRGQVVPNRFDGTPGTYPPSKSLNALLTPSGHHGRAQLSIKSPFEDKIERIGEANNGKENERPTKRQRMNEPAPKNGYAQNLLGATLSLSSSRLSSTAPIRYEPFRPTIISKPPPVDLTLSDEEGNVCEKRGTCEGDSRQPKLKQRHRKSPPQKSGYASHLMGATLTLSAAPAGKVHTTKEQTKPIKPSRPFQVDTSSSDGEEIRVMPITKIRRTSLSRQDSCRSSSPEQKRHSENPKDQLTHVEKPATETIGSRARNSAEDVTTLVNTKARSTKAKRQQRSPITAGRSETEEHPPKKLAKTAKYVSKLSKPAPISIDSDSDDPKARDGAMKAARREREARKKSLLPSRQSPPPRLPDLEQNCSQNTGSMAALPDIVAPAPQRSTSSLRIKPRPPRKMMMLMDRPLRRTTSDSGNDRIVDPSLGNAMSAPKIVRNGVKPNKSKDVVMSQATAQIHAFGEKQEERLKARLEGRHGPQLSEILYDSDDEESVKPQRQKGTTSPQKDTENMDELAASSHVADVPLDHDTINQSSSRKKTDPLPADYSQPTSPSKPSRSASLDPSERSPREPTMRNSDEHGQDPTTSQQQPNPANTTPPTINAKPTSQSNAIQTPMPNPLVQLPSTEPLAKQSNNKTLKEKKTQTSPYTTVYNENVTDRDSDRSSSPGFEPLSTIQSTKTSAENPAPDLKKKASSRKSESRSESKSMGKSMSKSESKRLQLSKQVADATVTIAPISHVESSTKQKKKKQSRASVDGASAHTPVVSAAICGFADINVDADIGPDGLGGAESNPRGKSIIAVPSTNPDDISPREGSAHVQAVDVTGDERVSMRGEGKGKEIVEEVVEVVPSTMPQGCQVDDNALEDFPIENKQIPDHISSTQDTPESNLKISGKPLLLAVENATTTVYKQQDDGSHSPSPWREQHSPPGRTSPSPNPQSSPGFDIPGTTHSSQMPFPPTLMPANSKDNKDNANKAIGGIQSATDRFRDILSSVDTPSIEHDVQTRSENMDHTKDSRKTTSDEENPLLSKHFPIPTAKQGVKVSPKSTPALSALNDSRSAHEGPVVMDIPGQSTLELAEKVTSTIELADIPLAPVVPTLPVQAMGRMSSRRVLSNPATTKGGRTLSELAASTRDAQNLDGQLSFSVSGSNIAGVMLPPLFQTVPHNRIGHIDVAAVGATPTTSLSLLHNLNQSSNTSNRDGHQGVALNINLSMLPSFESRIAKRVYPAAPNRTVGKKGLHQDENHQREQHISEVTGGALLLGGASRHIIQQRTVDNATKFSGILKHAGEDAGDATVSDCSGDATATDLLSRREDGSGMLAGPWTREAWDLFGCWIRP